MAAPWEKYTAQETAGPWSKYGQPQTAVQQAESALKAGKTPDYRPPSTWFQRFSDQVTDPFGVQDEIVGAGQWMRKFVTSGGNWDQAAKAYEDAANRIRAERAVAREENTVAPEILGGFATAAPTQAVAAAPSFLRSAGQAATVGGTFGGLTGFAQGEGGIGQRLKGAAEGAATGAIAAPAVAAALPVAGRVVNAGRDAFRYGNNAVRSVLNPQQMAIENTADRMVAAGLDPATARAAVSPPPSPQLAGRTTPQGQPFNDETMATIVSRGLAGEPATQIAADYGIHPSTVTRYLNTYRENNPTPMNIIDLAKEIQGEGASGPLWRLGRAAHSLAGDESAAASQALLNRQENQAGRLSAIARNAVGNADYEATLQQGLQNLRNEATQNYRQFYSEPDLAINQLGDLMEDPLFRRANIMAQRQARVEAIRRNQTAAQTGAPQEPIPTVDQENQVFSPEMLDLIQRQLRITSEGFSSNPNAARHARNLREVFLDRIEQHYPTFRAIRQAYAQGQGEFGAEGALQAGRDMTRRLGERADEALRGFRQMTPAQQELFRIGFSRQIMDDAANPQIGSAVANKLNTEATRQIIQRLWSGDRNLNAQGQRLWRNIRREAITTKTKNDVLSGARTAELKSDIERLQEVPRAAADVATGNIMGVIRNLGTRLTTQLGKRGATETMRVLTETDPAQLLPLLNRLARAAQTTQQRQAYVTAVRQLRALNRSGVAAITGNIAEQGRLAVTAP